MNRLSVFARCGANGLRSPSSAISGDGASAIRNGIQDGVMNDCRNACSAESACTERKRLSERIVWLDTAKGLLITGVVVWHALCMTPIKTTPIGWRVRGWVGIILLPFFMHAFFAITGYCSNFRKPLGRFLLDNAKTLLFPSVLCSFILSAIHGRLDWANAWETIRTLGGRWFLVALFLSKLLIWIVERIPSRYRFPAIVSMAALGMALGIGCPKTDFPWYQQALALSPFVFAGAFLKKRAVSWTAPLVWFVVLASVFWVSAVGLYLHQGVRAPWFAYQFLLTWKQIPVSVLLAIGGTTVTALAARWLTNTSVGPFFGKLGTASLLVYLVHGEFLRLFFRPMAQAIPTARMPFFLELVLVLVFLVLASSALLFHLLNRKYVKWVLGK